MSISVGMAELILLFVVVGGAWTLRRWNGGIFRWGMTLAGCLTVAAALTPADPLSTMLGGAILMITFAAGVLAAPLFMGRTG